MRVALYTLILAAAFACAGAFWNDGPPPKLFRTHDQWATIDDNRRQCKAVNDEIQRIILLQRATHDASEHWALEQRFMDLIREEKRLKRDQFSLMREVTNDWRI